MRSKVIHKNGIKPSAYHIICQVFSYVDNFSVIFCLGISNAYNKELLSDKIISWLGINNFNDFLGENFCLT